MRIKQYRSIHRTSHISYEAPLLLLGANTTPVERTCCFTEQGGTGRSAMVQQGWSATCAFVGGTGSGHSNDCQLCFHPQLLLAGSCRSSGGRNECRTVESRVCTIGDSDKLQDSLSKGYGESSQETRCLLFTLLSPCHHLWIRARNNVLLSPICSEREQRNRHPDIETPIFQQA